MKKPFRMGRRSFLLGVGGATLTVPFLPSLSSRTLAAEPEQRKFISWRITNGMFGQHWYPTDDAVAAGGGLTLVEPNARELALRDIPGPISTLLDEQFDRFRDDMILFRHIDRLDKSDHGAGNGLFGWSTKDVGDGFFAGLPPSIDQLMATHVFGDAIAPLNLGVRWSSVGRSCSVRVDSSGELNFSPGLYPAQAFQQLFADVGVEASDARRRHGHRQAIVDQVLPHYQEVRRGPRLSRRDRDVLDEHIEHMFALQRQLARGIVECAPPSESTVERIRPETVNDAAQAQVDIAIAALRCGITNIVNFYLDPDTQFDATLHGVAGGHHGASHGSGDDNVQSIQNAHHWHMRYLSDFLGKLADTPGTDSGTMLDDSLVLVNNEIGNQAGRSGNAPGDYDLNHSGLDIQCMMVGSAGGVLRTGNFLDLRTDFERGRWTRYVGTAYNQVLVTCMLAMGMTPDQWEVDGPGYGDMRGALYNKTPLDEVVIGDLRSMLPRVAV
ncbi:MAG: DUF1552 domain-containing protein [Myxococcota bacterium]